MHEWKRGEWRSQLKWISRDIHYTYDENLNNEGLYKRVEHAVFFLSVDRSSRKPVLLLSAKVGGASRTERRE